MVLDCFYLEKFLVIEHLDEFKSFLTFVLGAFVDIDRVRFLDDIQVIPLCQYPQ